MRRLFYLCLLFSLGGFANPYEVVIVPYKVRMNGEWRRLFVFLPEDFFRVITPPIDNFDLRYLAGPPNNIVQSRQAAERLFPKLQARFLTAVKNHGRIRDQRMLDALQQLEGLGRGRYGGVAITDLEDPGQVQAILSFVTPDPAADPREKSRLIWEKRLVGRGLRRGLRPQPTHVDRDAREPVFAWNPNAGPEELPLWFLPSPGPTGEDQEVKTWVAWPNGFADYSYVMYLAAELHKITRRSGRRWNPTVLPNWQDELMNWNFKTRTNLMLWLPQFREQMKKAIPLNLILSMENCPEINCVIPELRFPYSGWLPQSLDHVAFPPLSFNQEPMLGVRVERYSIEFDVGEDELRDGKNTLLDTYTEMGWKIFDSTPNPDMPGSRTYVATMDRDEWVNRLGGYFLRRASRRPLRDLSLVYDGSWSRKFLAKNCGEHIASPSEDSDSNYSIPVRPDNAARPRRR